MDVRHVQVEAGIRIIGEVLSATPGGSAAEHGSLPSRRGFSWKLCAQNCPGPGVQAVWD